MTLYKNTKIITPIIEIAQGFFVIKNEKFHFIGDSDKDKKELKSFIKYSDKVVDLQGKITVPGFIDIHTHGSLGMDYSSSPELIYEDVKFRLTRGVTGFLPTIGAFVSPKKILESSVKIKRIIENNLKDYCDNNQYFKDCNNKQIKITGKARTLGLNLEGPLLRPDLGAQPEENCMWNVDINYLKELKNLLGNFFKIITVAPELENALEGITFLSENDIIPSIGHTLASENILDKAIRRGAKLVTHILNTTYQPEQDIKGIMKTGVNEYLLIRDDIKAEAIMDIDGIHINPIMSKILIRCKGINDIIVVTDSFITPGTEKGKNYLMPNGQEVYEENGVNIQKKNKHVSGSAMTLDLSIKSTIKHTGISLLEAVKMVTLNPAKLLRVDDKIGSIEVGKKADFVVIDKDINIYFTSVNGEIVFTNEMIR